MNNPVGSTDPSFRALLEAAPDAFVIVDDRGRIALVNAQAEQLFGYSREELVGQPVELLVPSRYHGSHERYRQSYSAAPRTRPMGADLDLFARRKDGTEFPVEISLSPFRTDQGTLTISAIRDITARKRAEAKFRSLLESAPDAMVIVDASGKIVLVNAQTERLFAYRRHELLDQPVEILVPERYHAAHRGHRGSYFGAAHARGMGAGLELFGRRKDGSEFPVEISLSPLDTEEGVLVASAIRDITERKRAEAERAQLLQERAAHAEASRIKDEFIATLSHELRTPLNAILGWATLLQESVLPPEKAQKAIATVLRNARAQVQLVEDLLDISRIVAGKLHLRPRALDLTEVADHALEVMRPAAAAKRVVLESHYERRPLFVWGDPDRLQQMIWNLLSNAVKFSNEHGRVELRTWSAHNAVHLLVRDTGRGIPPRFLPHVFDRFRQADSSSTREHGGLGLGLALVKSIVELHGGTVSAASSGVGKGATFQVTVPAGLTQQPLAPREDDEAAVERLDNLRVLVVDDQPDERDLVATLLTSRGADVRTAGSAADAIQTLDDWSPQILVTDIAMPGDDGYVLLRRIRGVSGYGTLPAVAVTAHARFEDRERAEAAGFDGYLSKPIDTVRLINVVARLARTRVRTHS